MTQPQQQQQPDFQMYPHEEVRLAQALVKLGNQFEFSDGKYGEDGSDRRIFEAAAQAECGRVGIKVRVNWERMCYPDGTPTHVYLPGVEPYGRVKEESETDHDRWKWDVTHGIGDGQAGYVREDGTRHEDPIKRIIT